MIIPFAFFSFHVHEDNGWALMNSYDGICFRLLLHHSKSSLGVFIDQSRKQ